jgi:branched-chain amino acid transport system substrate-binding protein
MENLGMASKVHSILLCLLLLTNCGGGGDSNGSGPAEQEPTIKIGLLTELAGLWEQFGLPWELAAKMAIEEINAGGGVLGRDLELISLHAEPDVAAMKENAQTLIDRGAVAIVGPAFSEIFTPVATEVALPQGMLLITPSVTSPTLSSLGDDGLVWRTAPSDALLGKVAARYAHDTLGHHTAGLLILDNAYGQGLAETFSAEFAALGGQVLTRVPFPDLSVEEIAAYDYREHIEELVVGEPELLFLATREEQNAKISIALKNFLGGSYKPTLLTSANRSDDWLANADPSVVEGMRGIIPIPSQDNPGYRTFSTRFKEEYQIDPVQFADGVYDAFYLLALAIEQAGSAIPGDIADHLQSASAGGTKVGVGEFPQARELIGQGTDIDYDGASGIIDFDANGDVPNGSFSIWEISGGQFVDIESITFP